MKKVVFALLFTFLFMSVKGQESQTVYNFLRLPVSAHAGALGGDNISIIEDDPSLIFSNPALLSSVSDHTLGLNYMNYMSGVNTASASYNWLLSERATVAASGQLMDYGKMRETDANNIETGDFSCRDISIGAYLSYNLSNKLVGGITAKFIASYIGNYNSTAMCVDLGLNYYDSDNGLSVSAVARNLGGQLSAYDDTYEHLPFDLCAGVSKKLRGAPLRLSATLSDLTHWDYKFINHLSVGADVTLSQQIWVGAGYHFRLANDMKIGSGDNESSHGAGFTLGAGVQLERFKLNLSWGKYHVSSSSILANVAVSI
ncbi:MAG: type IX secretion system protein PorQ [Prevotella sp.]|nr:type IX secretion system protein PorQ [Prevotella sp.]